MPNKTLTYPKVSKRKDSKYYIDFTLNQKRIRLTNARLIRLNFYPNKYPKNIRRKKAEELADIIYRYLISNNYSFDPCLNKLELFDKIIDIKLSEPLSKKYVESLKKFSDFLRKQLETNGEITTEFVNSIILKYQNNTSFNTVRRHLNVLTNTLRENNFKTGHCSLRARRQNEILHKPIKNIRELLEKVRNYNLDLYLCCLFTYGCLLRPHKEIRLLTWQDFNEDLSLIRLSGFRVKSKRNRIVPVPNYIRDKLIKGPDNHYLFGGIKSRNDDYFKTLFRRFKIKYNIDKHITLYSFRHSGAIEIFKRTGSLTKLQRAMGHSSLQVSLTYLRGLEVTELKEEDMPMV